jgi:ABC-type nitrate/sulfonate/bicarbonate transport system permease component
VKGGQLFVRHLEAGYTYGFSIGRTSVKKLLPPQAMSGILLGMRGLVRIYVTFAIIIECFASIRCSGNMC